MNKLFKKRLSIQTGFTLVEIMVGLVIGLIATLVIMQIFTSFEGQKRSTTGTADAQTNGSIGMYNIQREVQMAGYGLPIFDGNLNEPGSDNNSALNCVSPGAPAPALGVDDDNNAATSDIDTFPIVLGEGGVGGSDTITVRYGTTVNGGVSTTIISRPSATELEVINNLGCRENEIVVAIDGTSCTSGRVISTNAQLDTAGGEQTILVDNTADLPATAKLTCVGERYIVSTFAVVNNELRKNGDAIISDIVNLQAQYGITATNNSNVITQWVDATALTDRKRIRAIRVAIVARNSLLEKTAVTTACTSLADANPSGLCAWDATSANPTVASPAPAISLAAVGGANYRYRVYETIIPIRNITFSGALL